MPSVLVDRGHPGFVASATELAASHPIEPADVAPIDRLRIDLALCAEIGGFRGREHVDWLSWQGEGAASRAGRTVA